MLGGSLELHPAEKQALIEQLPAMNAEQINELVATLQREIKALCQDLGIDSTVLMPYRAAVAEGCIRHRYDISGAGAAGLAKNCAEIAAVGCLLALDGKRFVEAVSIKGVRQRFAEMTNPLWQRIDSELATLGSSSAWDLSQFAIWLENHKDYTGAEVVFRRAMELEPKNATSWNNLGNVLQDLGRYDEAEAVYRQAIAFDAKFGYAWYNLGILLQDNLGRYDEAEAAYRQAIALEPKDANSWNNLGLLLQDHLGRYDEAEAAYRQAIAVDAKLPYPWYNLGLLLQDYLCCYQEAEQAYFQALKLFEAKNQCYAHGSLAMLYWFGLNNPSTAKQHAELGRQVSEAYIGNLLDAAEYLAQDQPGPAFNAIDTALADADDNLWHRHLDWLQRVLRFAIKQGYGEKFLEFMQAQGYPERYAPLYWAFWAALAGEDKLLNVNPEVRRTAEKNLSGFSDETYSIVIHSKIANRMFLWWAVVASAHFDIPI
ncbi:tetratricopeptide repeat protein [Methylocucumis oryzae]|uniref:Uncharacterized protein n=1 Tax=Methylocucumis oryzae TaxID=1632867 RepID=A0A0F3IJR8_9GAMM|nr:tetratricopeptide repeat protein [Methylocucumis oryzae]KJV07015.1 hypothetical protein VZ94_07515 [Methylocucumis oryzae]